MEYSDLLPKTRGGAVGGSHCDGTIIILMRVLLALPVIGSAWLTIDAFIAHAWLVGVPLFGLVLLSWMWFIEIGWPIEK